MRKVLKYFLLLTLALFIGIISYVLTTFPPIISGMGAKTLCSCVYAMNRSAESVKAKELQLPPLPLGNYKINRQDSSATGSMLWASAKAIYRKDLGCTLLAELTEKEVRSQEINIPEKPDIDQDTIPWPNGDKLVDSMQPEFNKAQINRAIRQAFKENDSTDGTLNTHAVIAVYKGQIIGEKYADGFNRESRLMGWSMAKSITNAMAGILVKKGILEMDQPAPIPAWQNDERSEITLNHLMHAASGLEWSESYFTPGDFHNMFIHSDDKGGYASKQPLEYEPGTHWEYSSGTSNLIQKIMRREAGDSLYYRLPYEALFYKTGMYSAVLEPDASGTFVGSSYGYASARDWARFGLLYLNDGQWNSRQILPQGWVDYSTDPVSASPDDKKYGAQWWLNSGENSDIKKYPDIPADAFMAEGFEGQYVMVVPSEDLVVARLGVTHGTNFDINRLVAGVIEGL